MIMSGPRNNRNWINPDCGKNRLSAQLKTTGGRSIYRVAGRQERFDRLVLSARFRLAERFRRTGGLFSPRSCRARRRHHKADVLSRKQPRTVKLDTAAYAKKIGADLTDEYLLRVVDRAAFIWGHRSAGGAAFWYRGMLEDARLLGLFENPDAAIAAGMAATVPPPSVAHSSSAFPH
jgi:hypothetical protein